MSSGVVLDRVDDSVAEAVRWVRHAVENDYGVRYWFLDNEPWHRGEAGNYLKIPTEDYARLCVRFAEAMRAVDPEIRLIANPITAHDATRWGKLAPFMSIAGGHVDLIDYHLYWEWGNATWQQWQSHRPMRHSEERWKPYEEAPTYVDLVRRARANARDNGHDVGIAVLEWNLARATGPEAPTPEQVAIMQGEMLMQFIEGGLEIGCVWPTLWERGDVEKRWQEQAWFDFDPPFEPRPALDVVRLLAAAGGGAGARRHRHDQPRAAAARRPCDRRHDARLRDQQDDGTDRRPACNGRRCVDAAVRLGGGPARGAGVARRCRRSRRRYDSAAVAGPAGRRGRVTHTASEATLASSGAPVIAIVVDATSNMAYADQVALGALESAKALGWHISQARGLPILFPQDLATWRGDGLITQAFHPSVSDFAGRTGVPLVNVASVAEPAVPTVCCDNGAIGRMAARHLIDAGYARLMFVGLRRRVFAQQRAAGLAAEAGKAGVAHDVHLIGGDTPDQPMREAADLAEMIRPILCGLAVPTGVLFESDGVARISLDVAAELDRKVPDLCGVVGVDNNTLICTTATPTLTSVDANHRDVGRRACGVLQQLLRGDPPPAPMPILVAPRGVVTRQSTEALLFEDELLVAAIRFIRDYAAGIPAVSQVVDAAGVSRRTLENRFREQRGRTILSEIHHAAIARAKQLLVGTNIPITDLHRRCGFHSYARFHAIFTKVAGTTPSKFRNSIDSVPGASRYK